MIHVMVEDAIPGFSQRLTSGCGWQSSSRRRSMLATARLRLVANECADPSTAAASRGLIIPAIAVLFRVAPVSRNPSCQQRPPSRLATQATGVVDPRVQCLQCAWLKNAEEVVESAAVNASRKRKVGRSVGQACVPNLKPVRCCEGGRSIVGSRGLKYPLSRRARGRRRNASAGKLVGLARKHRVLNLLLRVVCSRRRLGPSGRPGRFGSRLVSW